MMGGLRQRVVSGAVLLPVDRDRTETARSKRESADANPPETDEDKPWEDPREFTSWESATTAWKV